MMNKKLTIANVLMASTIAALIAVPVLTALASDFEDLTSASADENDGSLKLSVTADGTIPRHPSDFPSMYFAPDTDVLVFGYLWVDLSSSPYNGVAATIHPPFRDSHQNPDAQHTHPVSAIDDPNPEGTNPEFCLTSVGTSQGGLSIHGDVMEVNIEASQAGVSASDLTNAASFVVRIDPDCPDLDPGTDELRLGADVLDVVGIT